HELDLDAIRFVDLHDCSEVAFAEIVSGQIPRENHGVQELVAHVRSPGKAVMKRGISSPFRTIQAEMTLATRPPGPVIIPRTRYFWPNGVFSSSSAGSSSTSLRNSRSSISQFESLNPNSAKNLALNRPTA